ncbi:MAG: anthranilate phosphoribosyltransferase [Legionella sp.]|jgi:anthranilate phosphoribosyltransferase
MKANLLFEHLIAKQELSFKQMQEVIQDCISGQLNETQSACFLALMRMKGETAEELTAAAQVMKKHAHTLDLGAHLIDIVGTGGDGSNTFNVSTACSFVVAASGIQVAKHGNRSVSSRSGSADLLEQAGFELQLSDSAMKTCIQECGLAFLFAPNYHPAMQQIRKARQQLGIRTLFNLLGPLINPAGVKRQVVGVFSNNYLSALSQVLINLGSERHLVLSSQDGLDEISCAADTEVLEYHQGQSKRWFIHPEEFDLKYADVTDSIVDSPASSLAIIEAVFAGAKNSARALVLLNSAAAIYCATDNLSFAQAINVAKSAIDNGKAAECFYNLRLLTQTLKKESPHD